MKTTMLFMIIVFFLMPCYAQEKVKEIDASEKCKELYTKLKTMLETEQGYAKTHNLSISELGKHVANQLISEGCIKNFRLNNIKETCLYNVSCHLPTSDFTIVEYAVEPDFAKFEGMKPVLDNVHKIPDVNLYKIICQKHTSYIKTTDPDLKITCADYMKYFNSAMATITRHLGYNYTTWQDGDLAYTTISE